MKRSLFATLALLVILSMVLAAQCPAPPEPTTAPVPTQAVQPTTPPKPTETPKPTTPPEEKVTIRLLSGAVGQELELAKKSADKYMAAHPNITIEVFDTPDAVQDRLGVYLQYFETKSPDADLYQIDVIWPGDLAEHLIDLNTYGAKAVAGEHFDAIIQNNTVDGRLVGIPWFTDAGLLFY
ncbi:MAG: extracellular solute-binding protein, partial [Chloroflexi bacterium]|nr:extracellular solute-binding protein [Chloroflexota bacterium]